MAEITAFVPILSRASVDECVWEPWGVFQWGVFKYPRCLEGNWPNLETVLRYLLQWLCNERVVWCDAYGGVLPKFTGYLLLFYGMTVFSAWINDYIIIKCGIKLLNHSQTSTMQPLKFGNGLITSSHTLLGMWFLFHVKLHCVPKRGPLWQRSCHLRLWKRALWIYNFTTCLGLPMWNEISSAFGFSCLCSLWSVCHFCTKPTWVHYCILATGEIRTAYYTLLKNPTTVVSRGSLLRVLIHNTIGYDKITS